MQTLEILEFPDPRLRNKAKPVSEVDGDLREFIDALFRTMYQAPGIGLAATQVDDLRRVIVVDVSDDQSQPLALINPEIIAREGDQIHEEGCLSVPGVFAKVNRAEQITVRALNRDGEAFELDADGLLAVCIQHEIDHLNGRLFVDYLSPLKQQMVRRRLEKQRRQAAQESSVTPL